jgi:hypothetical protein
MHIRTPRAAIAAESAPTAHTTSATPAPRAQRPPTLWASRPLHVRAGRLLGVRLSGDELEVGLVADGADAVRWVSAEKALTERQAEDWVRTAVFRRTR